MAKLRPIELPLTVMGASRIFDPLISRIPILFTAACIWSWISCVHAVTLDAQVIGEDRSVIETIATTLDHLREEISDEFFELNYLAKEDLLKKTKDNPAFFFITDAVTFAALSEAGAWAVAAMKHPLAIDSSHTSGAAFITRKDRTDINSLTDLQDKKIVGMSPTSSLSYLIGLRELQRIFGPGHFSKEVSFSGAPIEKVVHEILEGRGDVGIINACLLERMERDGNITPDSLKVISPRDSSDLRCRHSTGLYPGWVMAVSKPASELTEKERNLILKVSSVLPTVPKLQGLMEWSTPSNNDAIASLLSALEDENKDKAFWKNFLSKYGPWLGAFFIFLFLLFAHTIYVSWLVRKRTAQLTASMQRAQKLQQLVNSEQEKISAMERAGIVGQLSSMIAHELQQPINAITNFSRGLRIRNERASLDPEVLQETLQRITHQSETAAQIVNKVRAYAKQHSAEKVRVNLLALLEKSIQKFKQIKGSGISFNLSCSEVIVVEVDPLESDLVLYNLFKNSLEACKNESAPLISITVEESEQEAVIQIRDNGPEISEDLVNSIFIPKVSQKTDGLGLGLSICKALAESQGGCLSAIRNAEGHLVMKLCLLKADSVKEIGENQ